MVTGRGIIVICSTVLTDSPSSQYKNAGCAFLAKKLAESNKIDASWIFTESDHGKGSMDGVGARVFQIAVTGGGRFPLPPVRGIRNFTGGVFLLGEGDLRS